MLTRLLVAANVLVYLVELGQGGYGGAAIVDRWELDARAALGGEWWRVITYAFLHGPIWHILFNMLALWQVGRFVEMIFGTPRMGLIYLASALGGAFAVIQFAPNAPTVGASGAIFGLFGAIVAAGLRLGPNGRELIRQTAPVIVLNLIIGFSVPGISNAGHIGGLVVGFIAGFLLFQMMPQVRREAYATASTVASEPQTIEGEVIETIDHPPHAGPHEEAGAPVVRDPRE